MQLCNARHPQIGGSRSAPTFSKQHSKISGHVEAFEAVQMRASAQASGSVFSDVRVKQRQLFKAIPSSASEGKCPAIKSCNPKAMQKAEGKAHAKALHVM